MIIIIVLTFAGDQTEVTDKWMWPNIVYNLQNDEN